MRIERSDVSSIARYQAKKDPRRLFSASIINFEHSQCGTNSAFPLLLFSVKINLKLPEGR